MHVFINYAVCVCVGMFVSEHVCLSVSEEGEGWVGLDDACSVNLSH